jgi:hypothetical protein
MESIYDEAQGFKAQVEASNEVMGALRTYARYDPFSCPLPSLGSGTSNDHCRLGQLESGLWLATRENVIFPEGIVQRWVSEGYAQQLQRRRNSGGKTPRVCLGVHAHNPSDGGEDRHFLIVEDLGANGTAEFLPGGSEQQWGTVNGEEVFYDFPDEIREPEEYLLMLEELMVHVDLDYL